MNTISLMTNYCNKQYQRNNIAKQNNVKDVSFQGNKKAAVAVPLCALLALTGTGCSNNGSNASSLSEDKPTTALVRETDVENEFAYKSVLPPKGTTYIDKYGNLIENGVNIGKVAEINEDGNWTINGEDTGVKQKLLT